MSSGMAADMSSEMLPLTREQRIQMIIDADHRRQAQTRRVGRCAACGAPVLADEEQVAGPRGPLHAACAPFVLLAAAHH